MESLYANGTSRQFLEEVLPMLKKAFGARIKFCGVSSASPDIGDTSMGLMIVLDELRVPDIALYQCMLKGLPYEARAREFLHSQAEIAFWSGDDVYAFCRDTVPVVGNPGTLLADLRPETVEGAVNSGACSIFERCVQNMLIDRDMSTLAALYEEARHVIAIKTFGACGKYCLSLADLKKNAIPEDGFVIDFVELVQRSGDEDFDNLSEFLIGWIGGIVGD